MVYDSSPKIYKNHPDGVIRFRESPLPELRRLAQASTLDEGGKLKYVLPSFLQTTPYLLLDTNFVDPLRIFDIVKRSLEVDSQNSSAIRNYSLRTSYGELKALSRVALDGQVMTHSSILKELEGKRRLLGRRKQSLECDLLNNLGMDGYEEIGYVQEIDNLFGKMISSIRKNSKEIAEQDYEAGNFARRMKQKVRSKKLLFEYISQRGTRKTVSHSDLSLFWLSTLLTPSTILSTDSDMEYLASLSKRPTLICDCVSWQFDSNLQGLFGRYRVV